ncbi:hypothetical protein ACLKA7_014197 [Drosophila subpalustris]
MESLFGFRFKSVDNFLRPQRLYYGREYSKRIYEKSIAKDNLYFLKLQYEKLLLLARANFREQRKLKRKLKQLVNEIEKDAYGRARAVENCHFLKIQIEQLKELRNRMAQKEQQDQTKNVTNEMKVQNEQKETTKKQIQNSNMWCCLRHRCVATNLTGMANPLPQQLRLLSDDEKIRKLEKKNLAIWSKQISELMRKRDLLALIGEYIELQEQYVVSKLRSNKKMLKNANAK